MKHPARSVLGFVLAGSCTLAAASGARADDGASPWHLALDAGYGRGLVGFVALGSFAAAADVPVEQAPPQREQETVRISAAVGLAGLALEGGATLSLGQRAYVAWSAGVRLETSWDSALAVTFRFAFVERAGDAPGRGGRAGIGLVVRPWLPIALYADASAEATTPPDALREAGTLFAYAVGWTAGARISFR